MAGEGTIRNIHQGDAVSAIAKSELQEGFASAAMYTSVNDHCGHHPHCLLSCSWERGCARVSDHLHGWLRQDGCVRIKFLHLWLHFYMLITKLQACSTACRVCLEEHIPKPGLTVFMHCLALGMVSPVWERAEMTPVTALYFISQDSAEMFPSLYVWESVCSGYHSAADWEAQIQRLSLA